MFRGLSAVTLDEKGRLSIPARHRDTLQRDAKGSLVLTIDTESPCLLLYPQPHWEVIEQKLSQLSSFNPATRRIQRLLIGHATEVEMDRGGRILIPTVLRDYASLAHSVMMVGQGQKFELWSEEAWGQARAEWIADKSDPEHLPPELTQLSL
ncbi:MAG: cell division/cell wall cluster transcriptional repressor MraZ [Gammaproteobacteria bacterium RIFCSPHIGHO2_12_FULL_45_9]|nr:MAG: cell division/cell wall cluster transcriptional repressor MraZ [Gammaproteobacteria bacterium RIFCSPHIGHO2_12_FULL_45_9]